MERVKKVSTATPDVSIRQTIHYSTSSVTLAEARGAGAGRHFTFIRIKTRTNTSNSGPFLKYELVCVSSELFLIGRRTWLPKNWLNQHSLNDGSLRGCVWFDVGGACISIGRL